VAEAEAAARLCSGPAATKLLAAVTHKLMPTSTWYMYELVL